ncbi:hypothetical protein Tco_0060886 [Tanacetum coccineum]
MGSEVHRCRRSKAGKRFGFVRFIKIFDVDRLVNNLCTIWVGRFKLHANIARFQRPLLNKNNSQSSHNKGDQSAPKNFYKESGENVNSKSYAHVVNARPHQFHKKEDSPAIVLDETYANKTDYSLALLGKVKDFTSLTNLNVVLANMAKEVSGWMPDFEKTYFVKNIHIVSQMNELSNEGFTPETDVDAQKNASKVLDMEGDNSVIRFKTLQQNQ